MVFRNINQSVDVPLKNVQPVCTFSRRNEQIQYFLIVCTKHSEMGDTEVQTGAFYR